MHSEPIGYIVGDSLVKIDDIVDIGAVELQVDELFKFRRIYTFEIVEGDLTTVYRCTVQLAEVVRMNDQQLAEYLANKAPRKTRLFSFRGKREP